MSVDVGRAHSGGRSGLWLTPLLSESVLAMPGRPASKLQPLHCRWLQRLRSRTEQLPQHRMALIRQSRCHSTAWRTYNRAAATAPHGTHGSSFRSSVPGPIAVCCARESAACRSMSAVLRLVSMSMSLVLIAGLLPKHPRPFIHQLDIVLQEQLVFLFDVLSPVIVAG